MPIAREHITGLLLAGGQGRRMNGLDKGMQLLRGRTLAAWALERLVPQVGTVMISANRHLAEYRALGWPVHPDGTPPTVSLGPLSGFLTGLRHCDTSYLLTVPCDVPQFPLDLSHQLAQALQAEPCLEMAMAATHDAPPGNGSALKHHPTFCLMRISTDLRNSASEALQSGQRKTGLWVRQRRCAVVVFEDAAAFANLNTADDLAKLQE